jgi:Leucine-rich repeat (LRR) protein
MLIMSRNLITEIKNLDFFVNLHVLNLSENRIKSVLGIEKLINLRVLNLSGNMIEGPIVFKQGTI